MRDKKLIEARALNAFKLSIGRAGEQCPKWVRYSWKVKREILKVYFKCAVKNRFREAYNRPGEFYEVDHIIPLHGANVCGLHVPWNLKVVFKAVNRAKSTLIVEEWLV
jgi:hypothetical protein